MLRESSTTTTLNSSSMGYAFLHPHPQPLKHQNHDGAPSFLHLFFFILLNSTNELSDLDALLKIKASMVVAPVNSGLDDWEPPQPNSIVSNPHCSFSGVSCDQNSRVTSLIISNVPLYDTIPPEIGILNKLVNLTLVSDKLTGELPVEMSNLTSIRFINFSTNALAGEFPGVIVAAMTKPT